MVIKKIKKLRSGKYQIDFDNGDKLITYDDVIIKNNLLFNKEIDSKLFNEINKQNDYYAIYASLVKKLSKKICSEKEYYKYIEKFNLSDKDKKRLTEDLKKIRLINDSNYLKAYVSDSFYLSNDGPLKIKRNLLDQNIDELNIEEELSKISYEEIFEKAKKIVNKKLKIAKGSNYMIKQRIRQDMGILGYSKEIIDKCLTEDINDSDNLNKDFDKLYLSYKRKEKDIDKLYLKIKQKLYQKGYSLSDIDNLINEKKD